MRKYCAFTGCTSVTDSSKKFGKNLSFYIFPKNEILFHKWAKVCNRFDLIGKNLHFNRKRPCICQKHFLLADIIRGSGVSSTRIRNGGIPIGINDNPEVKLEDYGDEFMEEPLQLICSYPKEQNNQSNVGMQTISGIQTCANCKVRETSDAAVQVEGFKVQSKEMLSMKRKLNSKASLVSYYKKKQLPNANKEEKRAPTNKEEFLQEAKNWISEPFFQLLSSEVLGSKKKRTYNTNMKHIAYTLHFAGPTMYRTLGSIMKLPSVRTLRRGIQGMQIQAGISTPILELLKSKASVMCKREKVVCIYFDEMPLTATLEFKIDSGKTFGLVDCGDGSKTDDPATSVLVCMIRGLFVNWKQPLSFIFTEGAASQAQLDNFISGNLFNLMNVGLFPVCITTDLGNNFQDYFKERVCIETPYILQNDHKIFVIPNVPQLIKSVRKCFMNQSILTPDGRASWDDIKTCIDASKKRDFRNLSKVDSRHLSLSPVKWKKEILLATQVLSNSMSIAISASIERECMSEDAIATARLCARFNNLFDILNSSVFKDPSLFKSALKDSSESYFYLKESLTWLDSLEVVTDTDQDEANTLSCIQVWKQAIHGVLGLLEYLKLKCSLKYILTRRLCLDDLDIFFDDIRIADDVDEDPSCRQFVNYFKRVSCRSISCPPKSSSSEFDSGAALLDFASELNSHA